MAWRPYEHLIGGEMEFKNNKATGYMYFLTLGLVQFDLDQNYIISGKIRFEKPFTKIAEDTNLQIENPKGPDYMKGFNTLQKGTLGDFTTGKDDNKYVEYFYFEWYSDSNGRVVYEGDKEEVQIITPLKFKFPEDHRNNQQDLMNGFLTGVCRSFTQQTKMPMIGIQFPQPKEK